MVREETVIGVRTNWEQLWFTFSQSALRSGARKMGECGHPCPNYRK